MLDADLYEWVRSQLPPPPVRVLEVGAGSGELAAALRESGYEVDAIDPGDDADGVERVALAELEAGEGAFDAAVAVVALHHVEPLGESLEVLFRVLVPGGRLIVDELDVEEVDERAADWLIAHSEHEHAATPAALIDEVRAHIQPLGELRAALEASGFELGPIFRGAYLYRWHPPPSGEVEERTAIAAGELPAVGARFVARRDG
jgi:2-polyprenyl-3-methyl-5-hydroxy-6-metoxy-1,4-benzoquinol methylase